MRRHRQAGDADAHRPCVGRRAPIVGLTTVVLLSVFLWAGAGAAHADADAACTGPIAAVNKRAAAAYEALDFEGARRMLEAALEKCGQPGAPRHAAIAETHLLLGIVSLAQPGKRHDEALSEFRKALGIEPAITLSARLANPDIQRVFDEATQLEPAARPNTEADRTQATSDEPRAARRRKVARGAGSIEDGDTARTDDSNNDGDGGDAADVANSAGTLVPGAGDGPSFYVGLGLGSGIGWTSGAGEVTDTTVPSGFHPSSLGHVVPELGYFVAPNVLVSLQLRVQFVSGATSERDPNLVMCGSDHVCSPSKGATAVFARAAWFARNTSTVRPYVSAMVGAGQVRHVVTIPGATSCGDDPAHPVGCVDTVLAGPVFLGPGAGVAMNLAPAFALVLGANSLLGFPRFTFHVDFDAGVALEF